MKALTSRLLAEPSILLCFTAKGDYSKPSDCTDILPCMDRLERGMSEARWILVRVQVGGRCSDCDLRNALTLTGRPKMHQQYGFKLTGQCHSCGGSGVESVVVRLSISALKVLSPKQRFVVERRFGLLDGRRYKQKEIAEAMGVNQSSVSELEKRARAKLVSVARPHTKPHKRTIERP